MDHLQEKAASLIVELKQLVLGLVVLIGHIVSYLVFVLNDDRFIGAVAGLGACATALGACFHLAYLVKRFFKS